MFAGPQEASGSVGDGNSCHAECKVFLPYKREREGSWWLYQSKALGGQVYRGIVGKKKKKGYCMYCIYVCNLEERHICERALVQTLVQELRLG